MGKYRKINTELNRQYRNDLNHNFDQIDEDIKSVGDKIENVIGSGFVSQLEDARDNANAAANNANSKASYADGRGKYANTQGSFAKNQGDYAKLKGDYADEKAILADQAAANADTEASNLDGLKVDVVDATQAANTAANNANNKADFADDRGRYANTEGKRAENAVSAIDNIVKNGPVLSVNGKVGLVDVTSEDVNYLPLNAFNEDDPITYYELGITAFRVNLSSNSWLGYTSGYANVETIRNFTSAHGVQRITIYAIDNTTMFYVRTSTGVASSPNWSDPKRIMLESDYATEEGFGVVKVDGETIVINDGVISAPTTEQVDWMYFLGNEYDGWYFNYFNPQNGAYTKNKDNLYIRCEGENERRKFRTGIVNVAKYQTIKVELEGESETDDTSSTIKIILHNRTGSAVLTGDAVTTLTDKIIPRKVYELDVSKLSGEYYLAIMVANTPNVAVETWCKVYKVWGE